jgi:hypothetical protein
MKGLYLGHEAFTEEDKVPNTTQEKNKKNKNLRLAKW